MKKFRSFKLPNPLIHDDTLSYSARRVGAVLYGHRNRFGLCHKSQNLLAKYAHCSADTVRKALEELERAGYITHYRNHKYSVELGRVVFDRNTYVCDLSFRGGFTMIPRHIMDWDLTPGAFSVCLFLCQQAGNRTRAFPSLKEIGVALGMSHATVCRAVAALKNLREMLIQACIKVNRAFSKNSYIFVVNTIPAVQRVVKGLKSSFLCHNSTANEHEKQSDFNMPSSLIIRELLWYLDNEGITRERRNIGATKKGGLLSIKQRQSALSSVPIASTGLQHQSCPVLSAPGVSHLPCFAAKKPPDPLAELAACGYELSTLTAWPP